MTTLPPPQPQPYPQAPPAPQGYPQPQAPVSGFNITTKYLWFNFLLGLFPTIITIDGVATKAKWGTFFFPASPGRHQVSIACQYIGFPIGQTTQDGDLAPGQVVNFTWTAPWLIFLPGTLRVS